MSRCGIHADSYRSLLQLLHVFCLQTFRAFDRIKADAVIFRQAFEAGSTDRLVMHEDVRTVILGDKPEALLVAKPFYDSFCQLISPPLSKIE